VTIKGELREQRRYDRSDVLLELCQINTDRDSSECCGSVYDLVKQHAGGPAASAVFQMMGELLDNALTHAVSPVGAFVAVQAYPNRRGIELAVADAGIGILAHLRHNPRFQRYTSSRTAIELALNEGVSGEGDERGNGLPDLLKTAASHGGRLVLRSQRGFGEVKVGQHDRRTFSVHQVAVPGTFAWLRADLPLLSQ
jgi:hypothetical protein